MQPIQLKLARTATGLSIRELAELADVATSTIVRFEGGGRDMLARSRDRIQKVLEDRGVIFIPADETAGPGVRLKA